MHKWHSNYTKAECTLPNVSSKVLPFTRKVLLFFLRCLTYLTYNRFMKQLPNFPIPVSFFEHSSPPLFLVKLISCLLEYHTHLPIFASNTGPTFILLTFREVSLHLRCDGALFNIKRACLFEYLLLMALFILISKIYSIKISQIVL